MTELTDRYVGATLRSIPEKQRADIEAELRASIGDAVEARIAAGEDLEDAEKAVLTDLGDPDRLASQYAGRPGYLIGPDLYFVYRRLLLALLVIVVPVVIAVVVAVQVITGNSVGGAVAETIGVGMTVAVHIVVWTTLGFTVVERTGDRSGLPEWSLSQLRFLPVAKSVKLGDTIATIVTITTTIAAILIQRTVSPVTGADGTPIPLLEPALWSFWLPFLVVVLAAQLAFELAKYRIGRWTWRLASVNLALNVLFAVPAIYLLISGRLLNEVFFDELGSPSVVDTSGPTVLISAAVIAGIVLWDVVDGFRRARL